MPIYRYEIITAIHYPKQSREQPEINLSWVASRHDEFQGPQMEISMAVHRHDKEDPIKNYPEILSVWNTVLDTAQFVKKP